MFFHHSIILALIQECFLDRSMVIQLLSRDAIKWDASVNTFLVARNTTPSLRTWLSISRWSMGAINTCMVVCFLPPSSRKAFCYANTRPEILVLSAFPSTSHQSGTERNEEICPFDWAMLKTLISTLELDIMSSLAVQNSVQYHNHLHFSIWWKSPFHHPLQESYQKSW